MKKLKKSPPKYFISSELNKSFPVRCWLRRNCSLHCGKRMLDMIGSCSWSTQNTSQFPVAECAWCNCKHSATCNIKLCVQFMTAQFEICVGDMYKRKLESILKNSESGQNFNVSLKIWNGLCCKFVPRFDSMKIEFYFLRWDLG